ncbi:hypothetical protein [Mesorhizobium sp. M7A.F.Ca.US.008.03.1.1]|uniref:hypothetical protein n=1 Tax=Mesorhizobium sp. M7A.F.Ca.US.008.03.1.1 TaxID=2496742 RepID=UPI000FCA2EA4|nr:hypothetical protein [Mesorhizobium sp. M7A.F.Ca.US.008.03.1.1]RUW59556.1 hypothetical protein EOA16_22385 [Mesorhizobium sp. M7A.F.Ca.US.008.03.1.1]
MRPYYSINTDGTSSTNLQLYALLQARRYWNELSANYLQDKEATEHLVERCVFIVATLGLSVSQLLGQNDPAPPAGNIASPRAIWKRFVIQHGVTDVSTDEFEKFIDTYDACRHFGVSSDGLGHAKLEPLDFEATRRWYEVAYRIWLAVIKALRADPQNFIEEIDVEGFKA